MQFKVVKFSSEPCFITIGIQIIFRLLPQQLDRLQCWDYWRERPLNYAVEAVSGRIIWIRRFMTFDSCIQIIFRVLPQQFSWLQFLYYWWAGFIRHVLEIFSGDRHDMVSWSAVQEFNRCWGRGRVHRIRQQSDLATQLFFLKESRLQTTEKCSPSSYWKLVNNPLKFKGILMTILISS
jgi:hypothetical protein